MKKIIIIILLCSTQSCHPVDLRVRFVNFSKTRVYVGDLYEGKDCDSCLIMSDFKYYCRDGTELPDYPILIKSEDSLDWRWKLHNYQKIYVVNADSLDEYCRKGYSYNFSKKKWVEVLTQKVENKRCRFVIR